MILVSEEDYLEMQRIYIEKSFSDFIKKIKSGTEFIRSDEYDEPRLFIIEVLKFALIGYQEYINLYDYANDILLDPERLEFFSQPRTKQEVRDYLATLTK